jgi:hypothetical protein
MRLHKANLLYSEAYEDKHEAAKRERQIKGWRREKKLSLIKKGNQVQGEFTLSEAEGSPCWGAIRRAQGHTTFVGAPFACS